MTRKLCLVFSCLAVLALAPRSMGTSPQAAWAGPDPATRQISVTGEADVRVMPDQVVLTLGVETNHKSLMAAKEQNDQIIARLIETATGHGIARKDVQTEHVSIEPRYESQRYDLRLLVGYTVRRTLVYTLRDVSRFDEVLTAAISTGANYVHGIQFRTSQLRKYRDQARALAIQAAREKAEALAGGLGQKLGRPVSINEVGQSWWSSYNSGWGPRYNNHMSQNVMQQAPSDGAASDTLAPGAISVTARVTVTFDLAP